MIASLVHPARLPVLAATTTGYVLKSSAVIPKREIGYVQDQPFQPRRPPGSDGFGCQKPIYDRILHATCTQARESGHFSESVPTL
jgi:hypothetical protein